MISHIKDAFKMNFKNLDWMDEETRRSAREKADAITDMIGKVNKPIDCDLFRFIVLQVSLISSWNLRSWIRISML